MKKLYTCIDCGSELDNDLSCPKCSKKEPFEESLQAYQNRIDILVEQRKKRNKKREGLL